MGFNKRIYRCLWRDKVDLLFWAAIIGFFVGSLFGHDVSKVLWVVVFYLYYAMYRRETFWQDRAKMYKYLKDEIHCKNPDEIISQEDIK